MKLYCTPLSHFSRKVRLVFDFYSQPYEAVDVGNVAEGDRHKFADNPLMSVPVLVDGETWLLESDHIALYLADKFDPQDKLKIGTRDVFDLNVRGLLNGLMANEVKVILAKRMNVPVHEYEYFQKAIRSIEDSFAWLEKEAHRFEGASPKYKEFHFVSAWDHLVYYDFLNLSPFPNLRALAERISQDPKVKKSSPFVLKPKA